MKAKFADIPVGSLIYDKNEDALYIKIVDMVYYANEQDEGVWINAIPIKQFSYPEGKEYAIWVGGPCGHNPDAEVEVVEDWIVKPEV